MLLEIKGLSKHFGALEVISNLNFVAREGEVKSIIGPNGAGKTTLFNVISGRFTPSAGEVLFHGKDITGLKPHHICNKGLARSFQLNNFFPNLSVLENVRIAVQAQDRFKTSPVRGANSLDHVRERTIQILETVGLAAVQDQYARNISYGDQRHLEIALALAASPGLLLLDEPTSGMSPAETGKTIDLIRELAKSLTILLIEHDMDVVMTLSEQIMVLHHGRKIAEGTPEEIEQNTTVQDVYLGTT